MFHMIFLQTRQKGHINFWPEVEIVVEDIVEGHEKMHSHHEMQSFVHIQAQNIRDDQECSELNEQILGDAEGQFVGQVGECVVDVVGIQYFALFQGQVKQHSVEVVFDASPCKQTQPKIAILAGFIKQGIVAVEIGGNRGKYQQENSGRNPEPIQVQKFLPGIFSKSDGGGITIVLGDGDKCLHLLLREFGRLLKHSMSEVNALHDPFVEGGHFLLPQLPPQLESLALLCPGAPHGKIEQHQLRIEGVIFVVEDAGDVLVGVRLQGFLGPRMPEILG